MAFGDVFLTKEGILARKDIQDDIVFDIPEWGGKVNLHILNAAERIAFLDKCSNANGKVKGGLSTVFSLISMGMLDGQKKRIFEEKDIIDLGKKNFEVIERIFKKLCEINKLGTEEVVKAQQGFTETR